MNPREYDPSDGSQAFQGDVAIIPVPAGWTVATNDEVKPIAGRLILQEGEVTGHHHAIRVPGRPQPAMFHDEARARAAEAAQEPAAPTARLFRDDALVRRMVSDGPLARADLIVGFLQVEHGPVVVSHEEHDPIRVPPGLYAVGRQVESAGAEERVVAD